MHYGFQAVVDDQEIILFITIFQTSTWKLPFPACHVYWLFTNKLG